MSRGVSDRVRAPGRERRSREVPGGEGGGRQRHRRSERVVQGLMEEVMRAISSSGVPYICVFLVYICVPNDGRSDARHE